MKKTLFSAMALGALALGNLKAQITTPQLYTPNSTTVLPTTNNTGVTAGFIGIGISNPTGVLHINNYGKTALKITSDMSSKMFDFGGGTGFQSGYAIRNLSYSNTDLVNTQETYSSSTNPATLVGSYTAKLGTNNLTFSNVGNPANFFINALGATSSLSLKTNSLERLRVTADGQILIGAGIMTAPPANYKLLVEGGILTEKLKVAPKTSAADWSWPDYVFSKSYKLNSLDSVETFINKNSHLPDVPSAKEIGANGFDVAEMDAKLLRKVEELTLYVIEISKKEKENKEEVAILKKKIEALETENKELKK